MRRNSLYSAQPAGTGVPRDSGPNNGLRYRPTAVAQVDQITLEIVRDDDHVPAALQRQPLVELQQESWIASSEATLRRSGSQQRRTVDARQLARQHHRFPHKLRRSQFLHGVLRATEDRSQGSDLLTKASRSNQRSSFSPPSAFCRGYK